MAWCNLDQTIQSAYPSFQKQWFFRTILKGSRIGACAEGKGGFAEAAAGIYLGAGQRGKTSDHNRIGNFFQEYLAFKAGWRPKG